MPIITLEKHIKARIDICFDLSRSIDLHQISTADTKEKAIGGVTSGLIKLNETVTWQAVHFGVSQQLTSKITAFNPPYHFRDEQVKGAFKYFTHDHYFEATNDGVIMKDIFDFEAPLGVLGKLANWLVLTQYMTNLLKKRNAIIKAYAENGDWQKILGT
jgi:ligand-binding SRPBCC domain-containing protein